MRALVVISLMCYTLSLICVVIMVVMGTFSGLSVVDHRTVCLSRLLGWGLMFSLNLSIDAFWGLNVVFRCVTAGGAFSVSCFSNARSLSLSVYSVCLALSVYFSVGTTVVDFTPINTLTVHWTQHFFSGGFDHGSLVVMVVVIAFV